MTLGSRKTWGNRGRNRGAVRWWLFLLIAGIGLIGAAVVIQGRLPDRNEAGPGPSRIIEAPSASSDPLSPDAAAAPAGVSEELPASAIPASDLPSPIRLREVTAQTGITFQHTDGSSGRLFIVETVASGMATFDYDGDGWIDIYFLNGGALPGTALAEPPRNRLYRNLGDLRFLDVTESAGVGDTGHGLGVAVGDFDNDGNPDLYVSNIGRNVLYRNNGDGTFSEVTRNTGTEIADESRVGAGVCFLDMDGDGDLDLFVANYLRWLPGQQASHKWRGQAIYPGPERFPPYPSVVFRNDGDGRFTDVSEHAQVGQHPGYGMGIVSADFDRDGDTDVFVGNDGGPGNFLFRNDGNGVFEEVGIASGVAYSGSGLAHGSMGADSGDVNNDGLFDLYVTSYQSQLATLYRNRGSGTFEDVTQRIGAGLGSFNQVTWGCGLVDLDNDARRDIFFACGHLIDNIDSLDDTTSYLASPVVLWQTAEGRFVNVSASAGDGLQRKSVGRGACFEDLDNDGDLDVVILNSRREPTVLRNDSSNEHHWLQIQLIGTRANRDGVGAVVSVETDGLKQVAEVHSGRGFQSHFGSRLHFGLGTADRVDRVEVRWIGSGTQVLESPPVDCRILIIEECDLP